MPRPSRTDWQQLHHVTSRGNNRCSIYEDVTDREAFYDILATAVERTGVVCHLDALMGNHYHLLLEGPMAWVSELLWCVNYRYALAYNRRHGRINHLFGRRFHCTPVADARGAQAVAVYVAMNPVRAGLCAEPGDWPFSAFGAYAGTAEPRAHLTTSFVSGLFGPPRTLVDACEAARLVDAGGRPSLEMLMPLPEVLTKLHVVQAIQIFGYSHEEIAAHYEVSVRTLFRWLAR